MDGIEVTGICLDGYNTSLNAPSIGYDFEVEDQQVATKSGA